MKHRGFMLLELEERLDALTDGAIRQISRNDYERLFGTNDAALGRFARLRNEP
jgi:hypothetical protein